MHDLPKFAPKTVTHPSDVLGSISERRLALGLTGENLDHLVGLTRGHAIKLENGHRQWGKRAFTMTPAMGWLLQALSLRLMLLDERDAAALAGAAPGVIERIDVHMPRSGEPVLHRPAFFVGYEWPAESL